MQKRLGAFLCSFFRELQALHFFAACVAFRDIVFAFVVTHRLTTDLYLRWVPRGIVRFSERLLRLGVLGKGRLEMSTPNLVPCPICGAVTEFFSAPMGPFCSDRCKMVDLGRWFAEDYRISEPLRPDHFSEYEDWDGTQTRGAE